MIIMLSIIIDNCYDINSLITPFGCPELLFVADADNDK